MYYPQSAIRGVLGLDTYIGGFHPWEFLVERPLVNKEPIIPRRHLYTSHVTAYLADLDSPLIAYIQ